MSAQKKSPTTKKPLDVVDRGDQKAPKGAGFCLKSHYKQWYKKGHLGVADLSILNSNVAWNLSCPCLTVNGINTHIPLLKWQFTAIVSEEFITFDPDGKEEKTRASTMSASTLIARRSEGHFPI
eukprot:3920047-Ditylum_brightwellii.AAC.1